MRWRVARALRKCGGEPLLERITKLKLPISGKFLYFAEGKFLVLFDLVDRTCGSENQIISMILAGFGARTPTKHSTLQVLSSEITN